jgi:glycogen operon protein
MPNEELQFHLILNAYWEPLEFELPSLETGQWRRWIDTSLDSPNDIVPWDHAPAIPDSTYRVTGRAVAMLFAANKQ